MKTVRQAGVLLLALVLLFAFSGMASANDEGEAALDETIDELLGIKYKFGGTTEKGFDCSGFTRYVFNELGIDLNRTSRDQATQGDKIDKKDLRKGDLVFFNTNGKSISHVGIYVGDGKFAHSSTSRGTIISSMSDKYYAPRYVTARRVMSNDQYDLLVLNTSAETVTQS